MAKTRVHELAKEFGVDSKQVIKCLKQMGEFVKSASSLVAPEVEMRFKREFGDQLRAGTDSPGPASSNALKLHSPLAPKGASAGSPKSKRVTSWEEHNVEASARELWNRYGLGDHDAKLALYLLENGLWPEDLHLMLRGRRAVSRLREGMESRSVLVREMLEVRALGPQEKAEGVSTKVVRRRAAD